MSKMTRNNTRTQTIARSAITGRIVPLAQAVRTPNTTVVERVRIPAKKAK
jgi:hypothetical protein